MRFSSRLVMIMVCYFVHVGQCIASKLYVDQLKDVLVHSTSKKVAGFIAEVIQVRLEQNSCFFLSWLVFVKGNEFLCLIQKKIRLSTRRKMLLIKCNLGSHCNHSDIN